jgi:hypothetical protein
MERIMTERAYASAVLARLLLILLSGGAWFDLCAQAPTAQRLSVDGGAALQRIINSAHHLTLCWPDFSPYQGEVKEFYTRTGGTLGWVRDRRPTPQARAMIVLFGESDHKGLAPEDYDASRWPVRLQKPNGSPNDVDLANFDAALTVSAMRYIRALHDERDRKQCNC